MRRRHPLNIALIAGTLSVAACGPATPGGSRTGAAGSGGTPSTGGTGQAGGTTGGSGGTMGGTSGPGTGGGSAGNSGGSSLAGSGGDAVAFKNTDGSLVVVAYNSGAANSNFVVAIGGKKLQFAMPGTGWATVKYVP